MSAEENSKLVVQLIEDAYSNLDDPRIRQMKSRMSPEAFLHEFGTVKIKLPRQMGHTTAAVSLLLRHPGSILFVPTGNDRQRICSEYGHKYFDEPIRYIRGIKEHSMGRQYPLEDAIYIPRDEERLKSLLPRNRPMVIMDRAWEFSYIEKEGIYAIFEGTRLFVELQ